MQWFSFECYLDIGLSQRQIMLGQPTPVATTKGTKGGSERKNYHFGLVENVVLPQFLNFPTRQKRNSIVMKNV